MLIGGRLGYTETVTSSIKKHETIAEGWRQLEDFVEQLHKAAHAPVEATEFYRLLLDGCVTSLAAVGGAVWLPDVRGRWVLAHQTNFDRVVNREDARIEAEHYALLQAAAKVTEPQLLPPRSGRDAANENPTDFVLGMAAVRKDSPASDAKPRALVELFMRVGSSPAVQQGWQDFLATICQIAGDFHTLDELRVLRAERDLHNQSLALLHRVHKSTDLRSTAFELVNEGRRFVHADRLCLLVRRGRSWRLLAASGVDRIEPRGDTTKRLQQLADKTARWGEPIDYAEVSGNGAEGDFAPQLPPELASLVERHVDESHARRLVSVPIEFAEASSCLAGRRKSKTSFSAVLIAEQFSAASLEFSCQRVIELTSLCEPALRLATQLDSFPLRPLVRWSTRLSRLSLVWRLLRFVLVCAAVVGLIGALVVVPYDFEIEAPATLVPLVERDIFATAKGTVTDVRVVHGTQVQPGDVLAVIHDPQLILDQQRVQGEIETTRKRFEAITIARTARNVREDTANQRLPLSADGQQIEEKLASLDRQRAILAARREALTLRSPIAGRVLTLDVQKLLRARPVERGQVLFTVADTNAGWRLLADVRQDRLGHVLAAKKKNAGKLPVRFRLAGDAQGIYTGHVESVAATAVLIDMATLGEEAPAIQVRVVVDEQNLPAARPGMTAQVRIDCGTRPIGYVWLHDVWETVYSWVVF